MMDQKWGEWEILMGLLTNSKVSKAIVAVLLKINKGHKKMVVVKEK